MDGESSLKIPLKGFGQDNCHERMGNLGVDEKCLELAKHCLPEENWTEEDRIHLAHAIQQTVQEFMEEFRRDDSRTG